MSNNQPHLPIQALALFQLPTSLQVKQTLRTLQKLCQVEVKEAFGDIQKLAELTVKQAKQELKNLQKPMQVVEEISNKEQLSSAGKLKLAITNLSTLSSIKLRQSSQDTLSNISPSEIKQALKNLQRIPSSNLVTVQFKQQMRTYSQRNLMVYKQQKLNTEGIYSCYVKEQRLEGEWYANQINKEVVRVEPLGGVVGQRRQEDERGKLSQHLYELLKLLYEKLFEYIGNHYAQQHSACTCHFTVNNNTTTQITLAFTSKLNNPHNYYTSQINSHWQFTSSTYSAQITIANHFYQNGNFIMKRQMPIKNKFYTQNEKVDLGNLGEKQIDNIINIIAKEEKCCQNLLQKVYASKSTEALKKLRRQNPLTQTKMLWNLNAVRMNQEINIELSKMTI